MDWIVRLPSVLYRLSVKKAGGDRELQAHIRQYLERFTAEPTHGGGGGEVRSIDWTPVAVTGKGGQWVNWGAGGGTVFCHDCQQVHTPGPCPRVT